jgi:3-hydroxybutyrate dehydrogenase
MTRKLPVAFFESRPLKRYSDMTIAESTRPAEMSATSGQLPTKPLKDKTALVTGSISGIGLGIARALAQAGCNIVLNGFGESSEIERERTQIAGDFGVGAAFDGADLAKPAEVVRMIEAATREFGRVDILVNNAGIQHTAPIEEFPVDRWDAVIAINLSANFHTMRAVIPQMRTRDWGRIINIASTHGLVASPARVDEADISELRLAPGARCFIIK